MSSPASGSETPAANAAGDSVFLRFAPGVQRWLWDQAWPALRPIQEQAARVVLDTDADVIIAAPTASGKTEAAWLPICSKLVAAAHTDESRHHRGVAPGVQGLYIAPLKALINDQYARLSRLCEPLEIPVHRWHGDVPGASKATVLDQPGGLLLITPESLEALFVNRGTQVPALLAGLTHIVIDELHSFLGTERGAQLQSLTHRVELALRRRVPRVGLSATLGDFAVASDFLRPGHGEQVVVVEDRGEHGELRAQLRGYVDTSPETGIAELYDTGTDSNTEAEDEDGTSDADATIAAHLFSTLRGSDNLVFANSRRMVEQLTDRLTRASAAARVPNEFVAHHGNLSREIREDAEARLKDPARPTTAVATSTLELGIDIGSVDSIAQIGAPGTVSGLRQRLGRSGRRVGQPAILRTYVTEDDLDARSSVPDQLRSELVQTIAMFELLLEGWYETPNVDALHLSTLIQQILSVIAQHGGVLPAQAFSGLCGQGPFHHVDVSTFAHLLRNMGEGELIVQDSSGALLHGRVGETIVNHYSFYAAFASTEEYRLIGDGRPIGSLPVDKLLTEGSMLIFSGRRWRVTGIDTGRKVITLVSTRGGRAPRFTGNGPSVADEVRKRMRQVLAGSDVPTYLDAAARDLLAQARAAFVELGAREHMIFGSGSETLVLPWRGDRVMATLALAFTAHGLTATADGLALTVHARPDVIKHAARELTASPPPKPAELAELVKYKQRDKYDRFLDEELLCDSFGAAALDVPGAWAAIAAIAAIAAERRPVVLAEPPAEVGPAVDVTPAVSDELESLGFAVIDVETTGLAVNRGDRVVEIAIVALERDGRIGESWSTLVNPDRDPGPTAVHGLSSADLLSAPRFGEVAGDIAQRIAGRIIVAHNALFDLSFLHMEFARAGCPLSPWPTLCTLDASYRLRPEGPRQLAACAAAEGITAHGEHTAAGDAMTTAELLSWYLHVGAGTGLGVVELGLAPLIVPPVWAAPAPSGRGCVRGRPLVREGSDIGLSARVHVARTGSAGDDAYLAALDRALLGGRLSDEGAADLRELATTWGLHTARVAELNAAYIAALVETAPEVGTAGFETLLNVTQNGGG